MILTYRFRRHAGAREKNAARAAPGEGIEWSARAEMVRAIRDMVLLGNVKRISIADADGNTLIELPHLLGSRAGPRMKPIWAAIDALARAAGRLTVHVDVDEGWPLPTDAAAPGEAAARSALEPAA